MELGLSLGDTNTPKSSNGLIHKSTTNNNSFNFSMASSIPQSNHHQLEEEEDHTSLHQELDLLPKTPAQHTGSGYEVGFSRGFDVNMLPEEKDRGGVGGGGSPPADSGGSSFQMGFFNRDQDNINVNGCSDDDDNNNSTRKKLRLSKHQSAFLEESFKLQNTLNPKQKVALAKQLNLRPRQVEVWFQNRRARTKLKQTEVDCEYLKKCCENLTGENTRLHKELQQLRALKSTNPFYMQSPATTLTMCPSCERVATTPSTTTSNNNIMPQIFPFTQQD